MPYKTCWYIEGEVVFLRYYGELTLDEVKEAVSEILQKTETSSAQLVHVLTDIRELTSFPRNLTMLHRIARPYLTHPRCGWLLVYGQENPVIRFLTNMLTQMGRTRFRMFTHQEDTLEFMFKLYPALKEKAPEGEVIQD